MKHLLAAVDLGSNSFRLSIGRVAEQNGAKHIYQIDRLKETVRLAAGLDQNNHLSRPAIDRAVSVLERFGERLRSFHPDRVRAVATNTFRVARNVSEFLPLAEAALGFPIEVIAGREEARLIYTGVSHTLPVAPERRLVIDIGGGSTELVWIDLSEVPRLERPRAIMRLHQGFDHVETIFKRARVVDWISIPLGVATLKDMYSDVADDGARFALMSWYFEEKLAGFSPYENAADQAREGFQIIGTSGTVTTVAASHLGLKRYDRNKVDGLRMTSDQIDRVINEYLSLGPEGRRRDPRIGRDRQSLIMSGAAILQALLRAWPTDRLSVADRGLREGLLYAQMSADGVLEEGPF
jgi:exopolyphosphatase/guanosine-5'-triphosphate,3'-diphosphate pyrophosphatase